jgi:hypothetical protein
VGWLGRFSLGLDSAVPVTFYIGRCSNFSETVLSRPCFVVLGKVFPFRRHGKPRFYVLMGFLFWQASLRAKKVRTGIEGVLKPYTVDKKRVDRYEIPQGSWFEWVSCAHYLAEIVRFL